MRGIYSLFLLFFCKTLSINKNYLILRKKVKTMYNKIKTCIQRTIRMDDNYLTVKDIIDSLHFAPGTKIKLHYLERIGNTPYIEKTRTVTVIKEYQTWILVDFGKYHGTINKVDALIDGQMISL